MLEKERHKEMSEHAEVGKYEDQTMYRRTAVDGPQYNNENYNVAPKGEFQAIVDELSKKNLQGVQGYLVSSTERNSREKLISENQRSYLKIETNDRARPINQLQNVKLGYMQDGEDHLTNGKMSPGGSSPQFPMLEGDITRAHLDKKNMYSEIRKTYKQNQIAGREGTNIFKQGGHAADQHVSQSPQVKKPSDFFVGNKGLGSLTQSMRPAPNSTV
jgi:hypothetical protein